MKPAYVAGFFDGEGCISIYTRHKRGLHIKVSVTQHRDADWILEEIQQKYGGVIYRWEGKVTQLEWLGIKRLHFLRIIVPFLKIKRLLAELAIDAIQQAPGPGRRWDEDARQVLLKRRENIQRGDR